MKMIKEINFDMDGTIADFYGVENWLEYLINRDSFPYENAKPLVNLSVLARYLNRLQKNGYKINIISWLAKNSTAEFDEKVAETKKKWLKKHLPSVNWDKIMIVQYGVNKASLGKGILFDDEENNRKMWGHGAYDVHNILEVLKSF
jgi:FMN phosphatase YigB (HAD superfamily)